MRDEFISRTQVSEKDLARWEDIKLVVPAGFADDHAPCYSEEAIERVQHIQKLLELGYAPEEIQKIVHKIGLPKTGKESKKSRSAGQYLTVGNLAEQVGVSPRTIKHWEDKGIIEPDMRSEGGFRLYPDVYVYLCRLIMDLQHFGYTLEQIKVISDYFREFLHIQEHLEDYSMPEAERKLAMMLDEIQVLFDKMNVLKEGIQRWESLVRKKKREIQQLKTLNHKRGEAAKEKKHA
jgi:DNA-binding transcriptional MerR regulator